MSEIERAESGIIIVTGPPGSGKGAMCGDYVEQNDRVQHISAGDLVRGIRAKEIESAHSPIVLDALERRVFMPDETFADIVLEGITGASNVDLTLLDGFPQEIGDWEHFNNQLSSRRQRMLGAVCLWATEEVCVDRMKFRGMRRGEYVRSQHSELEAYYRDRYRTYLEKHHKLTEMFVSRDIEVKMFDVNRNLIDEDTRQEVGRKFAKIIFGLRDKE